MPQIELVYKGLWKGVDTSLPETDIDPAASPFINNFILRKGEIRSRFRLDNFCLAPPDNTPVLGLTSFIDSNGLVHTIAITQLGVYQLSYSFSGINYKGNPWLIIFNFTSSQTTAPYAIGNFQNSIFFSNGSPNVWQWNGISNVVTNVGNLASGGTVGALYLMELAGRIVLASTVEVNATPSLTGAFPFRVRWSPVNLASSTFDPSVNLGAGFNDMFDCPDAITGTLPIGRTGYIFRSNGISEMIPTSGQGLAFDFNHLWASDRGIGNAFPQTLAGFGPMGIFGSGEGFYKITPNSFDDIGKGATDQILTDIFDRTGVVAATILPYFHPTYPYTVYMLNITMGNDTVQWLYDIKESSWTRNIYKNKIFTCKPKYVFVS